MNLRAIDKQEFTASTRQKEPRQVDGMSRQGRAGSVGMRAEPLAGVRAEPRSGGSGSPAGQGPGAAGGAAAQKGLTRRLRALRC